MPVKSNAKARGIHEYHVSYVDCYSLPVCHIYNFFQYILVPQTQKETKRNCVKGFCKAYTLVFFTVMMNGVFSINFILIYLQIKAIIVVKEKGNISGFKYHQHTFSTLFDNKFSAIVLLGNEYFLLSIKVKRVCLLFQ